MEQERIYLEMLGAAQRFELVDSMLTIYTRRQQTLTFEIRQDGLAQSTQLPTSESPDGFKKYQDSVVGLSIYIPESWMVTGVIEGQYAIFQSYPEGKYIGGDPREPDDTKCDLNVRPTVTHQAELIQQWKTDPRTTIVSEDEFSLQSGLSCSRIIHFLSPRFGGFCN